MPPLSSTAQAQDPDTVGTAVADTLGTEGLASVTALDLTEGYMRQALLAAEAAAAIGEVPVGAIVVVGGEVVAVAHNERETKNDPTAHAEVVALRRAAAALGSWRLTGADLYVTMEPCPMCAGALVNARLRRVIYGCDDPKAGAARTLYRLLDDSRLNHRVEVVPGVLAAESAGLLRAFFSRLRRVDAK